MDHDSIKSVTLIIQTATSTLIPILVVVVGLVINRKLEATKTILARERDWKTKWGEAFYLAATQFTKSVDEYVCFLSELAELDGKTDPASMHRKTALNTAIAKEFRMLHRQEWGIRTQLQYAPNSEDDVVRAAHATLAEMHKMGTTGKGSFEVVRKHLKEFNNACKAAYREMLEA